MQENIIKFLPQGQGYVISNVKPEFSLSIKLNLENVHRFAVRMATSREKETKKQKKKETNK